MTKAKQQEPSLFIQFAGQGVKYMDDLRRLYTMYPAVKPFIIESIKEIQKQADRYDDSSTGFFQQGLDIEQWIEHPEKTPDLGYLLSSPLSHPLIYLSQIANYISLIFDGVDQDLLIKNTHSATGFSTGIMAAVLVSMNLPLEELIKVALKTQAMFFWQGIRTQQSMLNKNIQPKLDPSQFTNAKGSPSCMASITNVMSSQLDKAIKSFAGTGTVYPSYELFPGRWIVAGSPEDLNGFSKFIKGEFSDSEWRYIPSTIAAHSPFLSYALEKSPVDAADLGLDFKATDLQIPVLSNDEGKDLRLSDNLIFDIMQAYFVFPAIWRKQITPLLPPTKIKYVLDFGPGPGVASLTENHTSRSGIQVIRCTIPLGRKKLIDEIIPELNSAS